MDLMIGVSLILSAHRVRPVIGAALYFWQASFPRVIASAICVCFAYLVVALYCILISCSYCAVVCLLLALSLPLTRQLLLLLINLLLQFDNASLDPWMLECLLGRHPLLYFPFEALIDEVDEEIIITFHHLAQTLRIRYANLPLRIRILQRPVIVVEEYFSSGGHHYHGSWRDALYLHNTLYLFFFILSREYWKADVEFVENTSQRPHINRGRIPDPHHDFWSTVEPTLNIRIKLVGLVRSTTKINHLYSTFVGLSEKDVFRFHITVYYIIFFHIM